MLQCKTYFEISPLPASALLFSTGSLSHMHGMENHIQKTKEGKNKFWKKVLKQYNI